MYYPQSDWDKKQGRPPRDLPDPLTYTTGDGIQYKYHGYSCNGPYSAPGPAKSQVTSHSKGKEKYIVYAEVESSTGVWTPVPKKK